MSIQQDVLVIGRGIAGLSSARHLARAGYRVRVIASNEASAASPAAGGVVSVKGLRLPDTPLFACKLQGHRQFAQHLAELSYEAGKAIPHSFKSAYELYEGAAAYRQIRQRVYHRQFSGCFALNHLTAAQLAEEHPWLAQLLARRRGISGSLCYPGDGWFDPIAYLGALEASLRRAGVELIEDQAQRITGHEGASYEVVGQKQTYRGHEVVVACGAGLNPLLRASGWRELPLLTTPGQTLVGELSPPYSSASDSQPVVIKEGRGGLALQGSRFYWGSHDFPRDRMPSSEELAAASQQLAGGLAKTLGAVGSDSVLMSAQGRNGVRVMAKDRKPLLGPWLYGNSRLWLIGGFHKSGFYLADQFAKNLCALIKTGSCQSELVGFSPGRFL